MQVAAARQRHVPESAARGRIGRPSHRGERLGVADGHHDVGGAVEEQRGQRELRQDLERRESEAEVAPDQPRAAGERAEDQRGGMLGRGSDERIAFFTPRGAVCFVEGFYFGF